MSTLGKINIIVQYDGKDVYSTNSPMESFFYSQMREFNELTHEDAVRACGVAMTMYLKDENSTPVGHLSDYVGKHFERLDSMENRWDMLNDFYDNYESEDYEIVNQYLKEE